MSVDIMKKTILFVISAPSGTGKTTLLGKVMADIGNLNFSISHTTRDPRKGEVNGREYHFVEKGEFESMIAQGKFLEWAEVHGNLYGTSTGGVADQLDRGQDVILDIDVQGASILQESAELEAVYIFIAPPSMDILEQRLRGRQTESEEKVRLRLENARKEMQAAGSYEYLVVNDSLDEAARVLNSIIIAERAKKRRTPSGEPVNFERVS